MPRFFVPAVCVLIVSVYPARSQDSKPNLSGNWQMNAAKSTTPGDIAALTLKIQQDGKAIEVSRAIKGKDGKEATLAFKCTTGGKDCEVGAIKTSLWYSGQTLVEMDAGADAVTKLSMTLSEDGKSMTMELQHIVPSADPEKLTLDKS